MAYKSYRPKIGGGGLFSLGRTLISRIASSGSSTGRRLASDRTVPISSFDEDLWEEYYTILIESQVEKAGNPGQETLLGDDYFGGIAKEICADLQEDFTPERFVSDVQLKLDDVYYNAINEIIDECAEELQEVHNECSNLNFIAVPGRASVRFRVNNALRSRGVSYASRSRFMGRNSFGSTMLTPGRAFSSNAAALSNYYAQAERNYGPGWNTNAAASARSSAAARAFLAKYPKGRHADPIGWALTENAFRNRRP